MTLPDEILEDCPPDGPCVARDGPTAQDDTYDGLCVTCRWNPAELLTMLVYRITHRETSIDFP